MWLINWLTCPKIITQIFKNFILRNECYCGRQYGVYGKAESNKCNIPCPNNKTEICGGIRTNSIYCAIEGMLQQNRMLLKLQPPYYTVIY